MTMHTITVIGIMLVMVVLLDVLRACNSPFTVVQGLAAAWVRFMPDPAQPSLSADFQFVFDAALQTLEDLDTPVSYHSFQVTQSLLFL